MSEINNTAAGKIQEQKPTGKFYLAIQEGMLNAIPSDVRYKSARYFEEALFETLPTTLQLIANAWKGWIKVNGVMYPIDSYKMPKFFALLASNSRIYLNEECVLRGEPLFQANGIVGLIETEEQKSAFKDAKILEPTAYNQFWERCCSTRISVPLVPVSYQPAVLNDLRAFYSADNASGVVMHNAAGSIPEEVTLLLNIKLPIASKYCDVSKPLTNEEVRKWISDNFLAAQGASV